MEVLILLVVIALFVKFSMWRGDRIAESQGTDISATPQWVSVAFFLIVTGLLFACLAPGFMEGLKGVQP